MIGRNFLFLFKDWIKDIREFHIHLAKSFRSVRVGEVTEEIHEVGTITANRDTKTKPLLLPWELQIRWSTLMY